MIKYQLICRNRHSFEAWFKNSDFCDAQMEVRAVACPVCGDNNITKDIMSPSIIFQPNVSKKRSKKIKEKANYNIESFTYTQTNSEDLAAKFILLQKVLGDLNEYIYVGRDFKELAVKMHHQEIEVQSIYGDATTEEIEELLEEGIDIFPIPMVDVEEER